VKPASTITEVADVAGIRATRQEREVAAAGDLDELTACVDCRRPMFFVLSRCGYCLWDVWRQLGDSRQVSRDTPPSGS